MKIAKPLASCSGGEAKQSIKTLWGSHPADIALQLKYQGQDVKDLGTIGWRCFGRELWGRAGRDVRVGADLLVRRPRGQGPVALGATMHL